MKIFEFFLIANKLHKQYGLNNCWLWPYGQDSGGYGTIVYEYSDTRKAHRVSYLTFNGNVDDGLSVLHKCDTPLCINPKHLFLGTQKDNIQDCIDKGRFQKSPRPLKKFCKYGHERTPGNLSGVHCIICKRKRGVRYMRKRRAELKGSNV